MNIAAAELKNTLRKLSSVKTESYVIGEHGISAQDSDVWPVIESPLTGLGATFSIDRKFAQVVNRMSGQIEITKQEKSLVIKSAKARVELEVQNIKPPSFPKKAEKTMTFPAASFKKALAVAAAAASPAKSAPFGGSVQIQNQPLGIEDDTATGYRIVGTDSIMLTEAVVDEVAGLPEFKTLLNLSAAAIVQLMDCESLTLGETNTHLVISGGGVTVYASKPVQAYPNFGILLSLEPKVTYSINPEEFLSALKTIEPLIDETVGQGGISLLFKDGVVQCNCTGVGSAASDEAGCDQSYPDPIFEPKDVSIRLKAKYLSSFLSKTKDVVTLSLADNPGRKGWEIVQLNSEGVKVIIMPLDKPKETK